MPASHRAYAEWTPERILDWMSKSGPNTAALGEGIMRSRPHTQHGFRSCRGIIRLGEKYGYDRLENACARAVRYHAFSYRSVEAILKNNLDSVDQEIAGEQAKLPIHGNLRGSNYYQ
jgi:transposase